MDENPYRASHIELPIPEPSGSSVWPRIVFTAKHACGGAILLALLTTGCNYANLQPDAPRQRVFTVLANTALFGVAFGMLGGWVLGSFRWEARLRRDKQSLPKGTV